MAFNKVPLNTRLLELVGDEEASLRKGDRVAAPLGS